MEKKKFAGLSSLGVLLLLLLAVPQKASAYADPGTGAMLWQLTAAAMIGTLFYVRRFVNWTKKQWESWFPGKKSSDDSNPVDSNSSTAA
ncbi:MAG TPA: hypothetical protein VG675_18890 [Bryobacteraceae bacterium]|nr:hypothetical protein [Bryobacteraceae bacterium]